MLTQVGFDVSSFAFPFVSKRVKYVIDLNLVMNDFVDGLLDCFLKLEVDSKFRYCFLKIINREIFNLFYKVTRTSHFYHELGSLTKFYTSQCLLKTCSYEENALKIY